MSGHSKWSTIKHQKGATDKKRGQAFSRFTKIITMAVKQGGSADPDSNFRLRMAIDKAKDINMPKDNIMRAIQRGSGDSAEGDLDEFWYEGFGPHPSVFMIQCVSDNANRSLSVLKSYLEKRGLTLGSPGSAAYLFDKKGQIVIAKSNHAEQDQLKLIDLNPDEIIEAGDSLMVLCAPDQLKIMSEKISDLGLSVLEANLIFHPKLVLDLPPSQKEDLRVFVDNLMEMEDVENVFTNVRI